MLLVTCERKWIECTFNSWRTLSEIYGSGSSV